MFNAVLLVNFIITDGVVVWRAWVICSDLNRVILMTPVVVLALDSLAYLTTVGVRVGLLITPEGAHTHNVLARIIDIAQVSHLVLSLLTNVIATSIIATKSWKYRKALLSYNVNGYTSTLASKVLGFLVESGMLYILIGVVVLASSFIRLCDATLGDILAPVGVQLAGIYPTIVLLVVDLFKSTVTSGSIVITDHEEQTSHLEPLSFARTDSYQSSSNSS